MCRSAIVPEAESLLAELLMDCCRALCPEDPEGVVIGPVDFGSDEAHP